MTDAVPNLFKGIAVVIDNGIQTEDAIKRILQNIRDAGGHAIELPALPPIEYDLEHFSRASFFIMDWNLANDGGGPLEAGVRLPAGLHEEMIADNIAFLKRLSQSRHAPVFIFSNEDPDSIVEELRADKDLHRSVEESHILVMRKSDVVDKLYSVLEDYAQSNPSVLTLKTWERNYIRAANDLFIDLHNRTPFWPVLVWQTFGADEVPPEVEMNKLLNRLVESRMAFLDVDLEPFTKDVAEHKAKDEEAYRASVFRVLEGERFLRNDRLKPDYYAPGDIFATKVSDTQTSHWMNVRAECDCLRGGEDHQLYLLKVQEVTDVETRIDAAYGIIKNEKDNETFVFAMMDGKTFTVKFKDMKIKTLKQLGADKSERIGRLLPPFVTRVQQRYSTYMQRPGLPRIPPMFYQTERADERQVRS